MLHIYVSYIDGECVVNNEKANEGCKWASSHQQSARIQILQSVLNETHSVIEFCVCFPSNWRK